MLTPQDLPLNDVWMNAAGSLGFAPPAHWPQGEAPGAFVTNPVSLRERTPAAERVLLAFEGGCLLHTGLPNPGLHKVIRQYGERWARSSLPVWVHLLGDDPEDIHRMALELEDLEGVAAIELGLPPGATEQRTLELVSAALGELPLIVGLPCGAVIPERLVKLAAYGAAAVTVTAPRISLPGRDGRLIAGHMLGPAVLPILLAALQSAAGGPLPLIASGGVYRPADREALLAAGACAVQLDSALWLP